MPETEDGVLYTAKQTADALGIGQAMLRRYASTYERLTGTEIQIHRRDGRLFTQEQLRILSAARERVQRHDLNVDIALEAVLRGDEMPLAARATSGASVDTLALTEALRASVAEPLLNELQSVTRELQAMRAELAEMRADRKEQGSSPAQDEGHSLPVRWILYLERRLRGR